MGKLYFAQSQDAAPARASHRVPVTAVLYHDHNGKQDWFMPSFRRGPESKLTLAATPFPAAIPLFNTIRRPPQYNTQALKCIFLRRLRNGLQPNWARPRAIAVLLAHAQVAVVCADRREPQRHLILKLYVLSIWRVASGRIAIYD